MVSKKVLLHDHLVAYSKTKGSEKYPPLIFLHGWGADRTSWFGLRSFLNDYSGKSYFLDLPGFGESELPRTVWGLDEYTEVVREFVERECDGQKVILIGHSFGGQIALRVALKNGEKVEKLVLVSSSTMRRPGKKRGIKRVASFLKPLFDVRFLRPLKRLLLRIVTTDSYSVRPQMYESMKKIVGEDVVEEARGLSTKTLILWGAQDSETPLEEGKQLHSYLPESELVIFPDAGHFPFFDDPTRFADELLIFVNEGKK